MSVRCIVLSNLAVALALMFPFQAIQDAHDRAAILRGSDKELMLEASEAPLWGWTQEQADSKRWIPNVLGWRLPRLPSGAFGYAYLYEKLRSIQASPSQLGVQRFSSTVCQDFEDVSILFNTDCDPALQAQAGANLRSSNSLYQLCINRPDRWGFGSRKAVEDTETDEFVRNLPDASALVDGDWRFAPRPKSIGQWIIRPGKNTSEWVHHGRALVLTNLRLSDKSIERLLKSPGLVDVEILNCDFSDLAFATSDVPVEIKDLTIDSLKEGQFTSEGLRRLLLRMPELQRLELSARLISPEVLEAISQLPQLEELRIELEVNAKPPVRLSQILASIPKDCCYVGIAEGDWSEPDSVDSAKVREKKVILELIAASLNLEFLLNLLRHDKDVLVHLQVCNIEANHLRNYWIEHQVSEIDAALSEADGKSFVSLLSRRTRVPAGSAAQVLEKSVFNQGNFIKRLSTGSKLFLYMFQDCENLAVSKELVIVVKEGTMILHMQ